MTYQPQLPPCTCSHDWSAHNLGTRRGEKVRTACAHGSGPRGKRCGCPAYVAPVETRRVTP